MGKHVCDDKKLEDKPGKFKCGKCGKTTDDKKHLCEPKKR